MLDLMEAYPRVVDTIASLSCFFGAFACVYLAVVILNERAFWVHVQRIALMFMGIALMANSLADVEIVGGRRATGVFVDLALFVLLMVMGYRGRMIKQGQAQHPHPPAEWSRG